MAIYSGFSHKKIVIFHSYVSLPEGKTGVKPNWLGKMNNCILLHWFLKCQWIGLRENLQETMVFTIKYRGLL